jgi:hypothetical protein
VSLVALGLATGLAALAADPAYLAPFGLLVSVILAAWPAHCWRQAVVIVLSGGDADTSVVW